MWAAFLWHTIFHLQHISSASFLVIQASLGMHNWQQEFIYFGILSYSSNWSPMGQARWCQLLIGSSVFLIFSVRFPHFCLLTMNHSSDTDSSDNDETQAVLYDSDPFNALPDELVIKITRMALNDIAIWLRGCRYVESIRMLMLLAPRSNFLVKVVSNISPR